MSAILTAVRRLFGAMVGNAASTAAGYFNYAAAVAAVAWVFGPGREWSIELNALELSGAVLGGAVALEWMRRMRPPGGGVA